MTRPLPGRPTPGRPATREIETTGDLAAILAALPPHTGIEVILPTGTWRRVTGASLDDEVLLLELADDWEGV